MTFDPELPAGFQDADIEMRELEAAASEPEQEWPTCESMYGPSGCKRDVSNQGLCESHDRDFQQFKATGVEAAWMNQSEDAEQDEADPFAGIVDVPINDGWDA